LVPVLLLLTTLLLLLLLLLGWVSCILCAVTASPTSISSACYTLMECQETSNSHGESIFHMLVYASSELSAFAAVSMYS
jgi:Kef-type K+ transport system membrane component KefB